MYNEIKPPEGVYKGVFTGAFNQVTKSRILRFYKVQLLEGEYTNEYTSIIVYSENWADAESKCKVTFSVKVTEEGRRTYIEEIERVFNSEKPQIRLLVDDYQLFEKAWHFAYYIDVHHDPDTFSQAILQFKDGNNQAKKVFSEIIIDFLSQCEVKFDYILRALGSKELIASGNKSLDFVGKEIQSKFNYKYAPNSIFKNRDTIPLHTAGAKVERENVLVDVYTISEDSTITDGSNILIIDDVTTTGTTANAIRKIISEKYPKCSIYFFAFGKHTSNPKSNNGIVNQSKFELINDNDRYIPIDEDLPF